MLKPLLPESYPYDDIQRFTFSLGIEVPEGIWLSGSTAARHDPDSGRMRVDGGLVAQAEVIFDKCRIALAPAGRSLRDLTRITRYVTPAALAGLPALDALQSRLLDSPDVTTVVVNRLLRGNALIEIEGAVTRDLSDSESQVAPGADVPADFGRARDGRVPLRIVQFFTAGQQRLVQGNALCIETPVLPNGAQGSLLHATFCSPGTAIRHACVMGNGAVGGVVEQCREAYDRLGDLLRASGATYDDVIKTTEYITPDALAAYKGTALVRRDVFAKPYPAATGVVCQGLPEAASQIAIEAIFRAGSML